MRKFWIISVVIIICLQALTLLDYLLKTGSERVAQQCRENAFTIQVLDCNNRRTSAICVPREQSWFNVHLDPHWLLP